MINTLTIWTSQWVLIAGSSSQQQGLSVTDYGAQIYMIVQQKQQIFKLHALGMHPCSDVAPLGIHACEQGCHKTLLFLRFCVILLGYVS